MIKTIQMLKAGPFLRLVVLFYFHAGRNDLCICSILVHVSFAFLIYQHWWIPLWGVQFFSFHVFGKKFAPSEKSWIHYCLQSQTRIHSSRMCTGQFGGCYCQYWWRISIQSVSFQNWILTQSVSLQRFFLPPPPPPGHGTDQVPLGWIMGWARSPSLGWTMGICL